MIVIFHFEVAPLGAKFVQPTTTLELKVLYNIIVFSKNLGQYLSFEGSNIFVEILEVGFLALRIKNQYLPSFQDPLTLLKMRKFCNLVKMAMFRVQKSQLIDVLQKCLTPQKTDLDLNF